jgi:sodium-dependent dicarboxylate transporter 2/3/5
MPQTPAASDANATGGIQSTEESGEALAVLSPAEERFDRWRRAIGVFAGPAIALLVALLPLPALTPPGHRLAAILALVATYWATEPIPIPVTALVGAVLCVVFEVAPAATVLGPFADPTIFLFLGSFILARAMTLHGLDRRFAFGILALPGVAASPRRVLFACGAASAAASMWISNTATTAMMLPIGLGIVDAMRPAFRAADGGDDRAAAGRFGTALMLMVAYASSVGGIGTPVGTPPNLIGIALIEKATGTRVAFFQWMLFAVPLTAVLFLALFWLLRRQVKVCASSQATVDFVRREARRLGHWSRGQVNTLVAFGVAVVLWILPGVLAVVAGSAAPATKAFNARVPEAVAALVAALLLFVLPVDLKRRQATLSWRQAVHIDWGTLILFGGGLSLGKLMFETGLAEVLGRALLGGATSGSVWVLTAAAILLAITLTEFTSNTAAANMVVPIMIAMAQSAGLNPLPPALGATLGASLAFVLPVSTPPNAIVYGSGLVPITRMIRTGIVFDAIGAVILWVGLRLLLPLLGWA